MSDDIKQRGLDEEIRKALREGDDALPPGFHARLRERFLKRRPARGFGGLRILSWEAAGLAAAVVLTVALFVPDLMRRGSLEPSAGRPEGTGSTAVGRRAEKFALDEAAGKLSDSAATAEDPQGRSGATPGQPEEQHVTTKRESSIEEPAPAFSPEPPKTAARSKARKEAEKVAANEPLARLEDDRDVLGQEVARDAALPSPPARSAPSRTAAAEGLARSAHRAGAVELPAGVAAAGVRIVDGRAEWQALLEGPAASELRRLGGPDPALRLVLLGGESIACETVAVLTDPDAYRIRFREAPAGATGSDGCAFTLPRDGRPLRLEAQAAP